MKYQPTIGLEIHAELKTQTKMFCGCKNDPDEPHPNVNVCPVCLGHPGTLPTINKKAVEHVIRVGLALHGKIAERSKFDRKNYFYPDLPKGYQISQYDEPIVSGGELAGVRIRRIHLEEDAGNLSHKGKSVSLVDYNRAGVPLMELVTEPDIRDAEGALKFARELQLILRTLHVSDANMEKGEMRIEVNISMNMGTKIEVKNINSFKAVEGAIRRETERQTKALDNGEELRQETRGWDDVKRTTVHQRFKEDAHDYRYFPEPDLPVFTSDIFDLVKLKAELPELPEAKRARFVSEYALTPAQAELLINEPETAAFFESAISELRADLGDTDTSSLFNYLTSDLRGLMLQDNISFNDLKISPEEFAHLLRLIREKTLSSRQAKDILAEMVESGEDPETIMNNRGFGVATNTAELSRVVKEIVKEQPQAAADFKKGKEASLQFLIGQGMKALKGRVRPDELREALLQEIGD